MTALASLLSAPTTRDAPASAALAASVSVLDVGASKTACLIGRAAARGAGALVEGLGCEAAPGYASGKAADFDACARGMRIALDEAERGAGLAAACVTLSYAGPGLRGGVVRGGVKLRSGRVGPREVQAALAAAIQSAPAPGCAALHVLPLGYSVDGGEAIPDPRGLEGRWLEAEACVVTAPAQAIEALKRCARGAGAAPEAVVAGPYAAALGAASEEERESGVLVIDLGAGGAGVAAMAEGALMHLDHIPIGGARITRDLARRLSTTFAVAERVKLMHGVVGGGFNPREAIETPRVGADGRLESHASPRGLVADAIAARLAEIFRLARASLDRAGLEPHRMPRRAILVGGGAQLPGAAEFAADYLKMPTRVGRLHGAATFDHVGAAPGLATASGLLDWRLTQCVLENDEERPAEFDLRALGAQAAIAATRAWGWLKQNF
jgi:cell division protein FtsA